MRAIDQNIVLRTENSGDPDLEGLRAVAGPAPGMPEPIARPRVRRQSPVEGEPTMQQERPPHHRWRRLDAVQFAAIVSIALALVPAGAHLAELLNKFRLPPADYMTVQSIYRGWALFGITVFAAILLTGLHTYLVRRSRTALFWSAISFACMVGTQVVFWTFTYPMNAATQNWTVMPDDIEGARLQWELAHAVGGVLSLAALVAVVLSVLASRPYISTGILNAIERNVEARLSHAHAGPASRRMGPH